MKKRFTALFLCVFSLLGYATENDSVSPASQEILVDAESNDSIEVCLVENFNYFVDWLGKTLKTIEEEYLPSKFNEIFKRSGADEKIKGALQPDVKFESEEKLSNQGVFEQQNLESASVNASTNQAIELPRKPLDLTIPDIEYSGTTMALDEGKIINMPDLFSDEYKTNNDQQETGASFGGRLLLDEAKVEGMHDYRFNDMKDAILGAELSLEIKTN